MMRHARYQTATASVVLRDTLDGHRGGDDIDSVHAVRVTRD
jgi:hypothetical protein